MPSHIAPEVMKGAPHLPRHIMRHDTLLNQITKYIQHTSKEDEMEDITTLEKTEDGWEAFQRDMAILAFFERPISMCVLSGWMGGLPERHGRPGPLRATHQYVCLVRMDGRPSRETWPSWPSSSDPSVCVCQDGWEAFQRDMAVLAFFGRPISMCVLSGWMGGLPVRHGHPGLLRATHQYVCVRMDGRPSRETWPSWPSSGDPSVCVSCQDGWEAFQRDMAILDGLETFQRDMAILAFFGRPISMCVLSGWMGDLPERHGHPGLLRATHQYVCLVRMDGRPSRETWPSWPSSGDPSVCVFSQDGWEAFQRDMAILAFIERPIKAFRRDTAILSFFEKFFDDPLRGVVARMMYDAYVRLMNQTSTRRIATTDKKIVSECKDGLVLMENTDESTQENTDESTQENTDESTQEKTDESTQEKTDESTQEKTDESIRQNTDEPTRKNTDEPTQENTDEPTQEITDEPTRQNTDESTRQNTDEPTQENTDEPTQENTDESTQENTNESIRQNTDESTQENTDESTQENTDESTQENTNESIRQNTDKSTRQNTDEPTQENTDESIRQNTDEPTRQNTDESTQENTNESIRQNTDESTQENTNESIRQNTDESTQENTDKSTRQNTEEPTRQNTDEPTRQNTDEPTQQNTDEPTQQNTDEPTRQNTDESK
ncbi:hypothetical protein Bbelb_351130 [Branchiostoma belcheri]|nr:hypothetical protein Bbelb_351130 [Branchiostoma belcheri]